MHPPPITAAPFIPSPVAARGPLRLALVTLLLMGLLAPLPSQEPPRATGAWWFGVASGVNANVYRGSTQRLDGTRLAPVVFQEGGGEGFTVAALVEFLPPRSRWGAMLQAGVDDRGGAFATLRTPCHCPADLATGIRYFSVEPSVRFTPFRSGMYVFAGPRLAFNLAKTFSYTQGVNPSAPAQSAPQFLTGDFSEVREALLSFQVGAGFDIPLTARAAKARVVLSPFVSFHPYFGQDPRSIETWNVTTVRFGLLLKFASGRPTPISKPGLLFRVESPRNLPVERRVRENFPLLNYVFFDPGSTEIPARYTKISKEQVEAFSEKQLEVLEPKDLSGRLGRNMIVYHHVLNILGDRMARNPAARLTLVGSSESGPADGWHMAAAVFRYLTETFGLDETRFKIEGRLEPKIPSRQAGPTPDAPLLREGNRRVSIESRSPEMLMEFQSGARTPLKPVEILGVEEAPIDSYVVFQVDTASLTSWSLALEDEAGLVKTFGPLRQGRFSLPGKAILGARPRGETRAIMIGVTKRGAVVTNETNVHMVLWAPGPLEMGLRYSVVFEWNESRTLALYEKYLAEIVARKIPLRARVLIHGHTDNIGTPSGNLLLSQARARMVKNILAAALLKTGRNDARFEVLGFGEDPDHSPYGNRLPEERFYNRTVIIDILPQP